jgi:hypothetical protein
MVAIVAMKKSSEVVISTGQLGGRKYGLRMQEVALKPRDSLIFIPHTESLGAGFLQSHRKLLMIFLILAALPAVGETLHRASPAAADSSPSTPVLVELFTSEGCSSCPPADALLERMDSSQPVHGAQLIVLSEHVDYWNHDGWTDPFSSESMTDRQNGYVRMLGLKTPYTPQFLVDGTEEMQANDTQKIANSLEKAGSTAKVAMRLSSVTVSAENPAVIQGHIDTDVNPQKHKADVFVAIALDHAESQVKRGENSGRHLSHVAVVAEILKVGKLESGKTFAQDFHVKLKLPPTYSKSIESSRSPRSPGRVKW